MSNRAATTLAIAAVISLLCLYAAFAGSPARPREATGSAVAPGIWLDQELPGRYRLEIPVDGSSQTELIVFDTHTGQCWSKMEGLSSWKDWGSPVKGR